MERATYSVDPRIVLAFRLNSELVDLFSPPDPHLPTSVVIDVHETIFNVKEPFWWWVRRQTRASRINVPPPFNIFRKRDLFDYPFLHSPNYYLVLKGFEFVKSPRLIKRCHEYEGSKEALNHLANHNFRPILASSAFPVSHQANLELLEKFGYLYIDDPSTGPVFVGDFWQRENPKTSSGAFKVNVCKEYQAPAQVDDDPNISSAIIETGRLAFLLDHGNVKIDLPPQPFLIICRDLPESASILLQAKSYAATLRANSLSQHYDSGQFTTI